jgi:RND family efflux transporter MFP subunit
MNLKPFRNFIVVAIILLVAIGGWLAANHFHASDSTGRAQSKTLYTCGMHPQVIQDHPGNCPICGMKLTPIRKQEIANTNQASAGAPSETIAIDPSTIQTMGIRTATVKRGPLRRTIRAVGVIAYNETTTSQVTTKFKGWIEKLHANATGQLVMRGDPLFEIYSPDLYSAQTEYALAMAASNSPGSDQVRASALNKLKFFDISDKQIAELERTRQPRKTMEIVAPQDGFIVEKNAVEGQMADAGMKLYGLADLGLVWAMADIYEQDLAYVKLGQEAVMRLSYLPDREFRGRVTYIYPSVDEKSRTVRVRMEFHNPGYFLKPGMYATVRIVSELDPAAILAPDMAILRSGEKCTVFVALEGGKFEPRAVTLGPQGENDEYQILSGLEEGERIVTSGQFMLDSESQLREAVAKMSAPNANAGGSELATETTNAGFSTTNAAGAGNQRAVKYICPMPEHVSIVYEHPGKCPICGMVLVPVSPATLQRLQPGGKLLYYTCPMPEHADVHSDKPGTCPKCGMTLIPVSEAPPLTPPERARTTSGG